MSTPGNLGNGNQGNGNQENPGKADTLDRVKNFKGVFRKVRDFKNPSIDSEDVIEMVDGNGKQYSIPNDPRNRDWKFYQEWVNDGRQTLPSE